MFNLFVAQSLNEFKRFSDKKVTGYNIRLKNQSDAHLWSSRNLPTRLPENNPGERPHPVFGLLQDILRMVSEKLKEEPTPGSIENFVGQLNDPDDKSRTVLPDLLQVSPAADPPYSGGHRRADLKVYHPVYTQSSFDLTVQSKVCIPRFGLSSTISQVFLCLNTSRIGRGSWTEDHGST